MFRGVRGKTHVAVPLLDIPEIRNRLQVTRSRGTSPTVRETVRDATMQESSGLPQGQGCPLVAIRPPPRRTEGTSFLVLGIETV